MLAYTSQAYAKDMDMQLAVSYIPYATSARRKNDDIITFKQFEEGSLLSETRTNTESGNESDEDQTLAPLMSEEEIYAMSSGDESDAEPMSKDILEDIHDESKCHPSINRREARSKIRDSIKQY